MKRTGSSSRQRGVAALEFALVLIFLLLIVAGIVEFGRAFWYYDALTKATRDGARLLSIADKETFLSGGYIDAAKNRVTQNANAANLNPPLNTGHVTVNCLDANFGKITCGSGAGAPQNVQVIISGYTIDIGGLIPFLSANGGVPKTFDGIALSPQTTMRYMN